MAHEDRFDPTMAEEIARRMFHRMLAGWAGDVLTLRREGLDRPSMRGAEAPVMPLKQAA